MVRYSYNHEDLEVALIGGLIISFAVSLHLFLKGRKFGGINTLEGIITPKADSYWKITFFLSIVITTCFWFKIYEFGTAYKNVQLFDSP